MSKHNAISKKDYNKCKNAIRATIRQQFARSDHYKEFIDKHRVEWKEKLISENFKVSYRKRVSYRCQCCGELFSKGEINVDHIKPIGTGVLNTIQDTYEFYMKVYCSHENLQILCKDKCHKNKTKNENYYNKLKF